ncbi:uncharacterized protein LOC8068075 isoform X2 [Sorghum bicolor]|uniref:uncharacterized protein LOC8068075 isoform X2 n=1 Tax=Sorghum bicolor TaxID=4558 RepID=UPI000B425E9D|nr:uncharacterized protein LOC8068075 isoform X2 [Sorghum bicolor]|eukprot:XP_021321882.1 uncharacterized protein LOC8068075 isoform X2 [Sorghum bicolor]
MSHSSEEDARRRAVVEVYLPENLVAASDATAVSEEVRGTSASASASSAAPTEASLIAEAIAKLPPDLVCMAEDKKRKAKSADPGWKYGFWPDPGKKEFIQCIFCEKVVPAGIKRFKQHLAGGFCDAVQCHKAPELVRREMNCYLAKRSRAQVPQNQDTGVESETEEDTVEVGGSGSAAAPAAQPAAHTSVKVPNSGTKSKQGKKIAQASMGNFVVSAPPKPQTQKHSKSVSSLLCKSPEEVVAERHKSKMSQPTLEYSTKSKEAKQIVDDHVADFFYENGISLNAINSRSWEIMLESIGQYGPGYRSPSYHQIRNPLLDRAVNKTEELKKKHEQSWKEYGCTIMTDGWTDTSHRHLINFLANIPAGTFFLGSVDASSEIANASLLADLLEKQIDKVGKENVVQIVTDNGANFKAAGRILMERVLTLFWTPCAAHCLDLMMEDIGKIREFSSCINSAKKVCRFIYKHGRILDLMREKIGGDLVRPAVTRFATSYLTLASMHKNKAGLRSMFVSEEWQSHNLSKSSEGRRAENTVLSIDFWKKVEYCIKATQPLLIALRIADGDETPALPKIMAAMDVAKKTIKETLADKQSLLDAVMECYGKRWENQMEQKLYGAGLFLNPGKYFAIKEKDMRQARKLRCMFNDIVWKMVPDESEARKISKQADDYDRAGGESFSKRLAIIERNNKNPVLWWDAFGVHAFELQSLAKRIVSLCCSASGCERNWSAFAHVSAIFYGCRTAGIGKGRQGQIHQEMIAVVMKKRRTELHQNRRKMQVEHQEQMKKWRTREWRKTPADLEQMMEMMNSMWM